MTGLFGKLCQNETLNSLLICQWFQQKIVSSFSWKRAEKINKYHSIISKFWGNTYHKQFSQKIIKTIWICLCNKVSIIKNETFSEIENSITFITFGQSIWNFVKITISWVLDISGKSVWLDQNCGCYSIFNFIFLTQTLFSL